MELTKRQIQVAKLVGKGLTDKAIATELGISVFTVREYVRDAAARVPGDGWPKHRLLLWFLNIDQESA